MKRAIEQGGEQDLVYRYLREIGTFPLIDRSQEVQLAQVIEAGRVAQARLDAGENTASTADEQQTWRSNVRDGEAATAMFVQANLRLVVSIAKRYQASG